MKNSNNKPIYKKENSKKSIQTKNLDQIRLNKYISNSGVCSRRDADLYIQSGNVKVNGIVVTEMGYKVHNSDLVEFDGRKLNPEKKVYILLNKPKGFTTAEDQKTKPVSDLIRTASNYQLYPVGRMDATTTGLLLFTNDKDLITKFSLPQQKSTKIYQVSLDKNLKYEDLEKITKGVTIDNHRLFVEEVSYIEDSPKTEIGIKLRTANVKVVRNIFEQLDYNVLKVDRVSFAGLTKKNLPKGIWRVLTDQEIINLKNN
ncbi:MAG: pseudouridine synthase [Flavobacterium sp.]|jgi:23S rRNA pseudouridine2605 synthase